MKEGPRWTHCGKVSLGDRQCVCECVNVCVCTCMYKPGKEKIVQEYFVVRLWNWKIHTIYGVYTVCMCWFYCVCVCVWLHPQQNLNAHKVQIERASSSSVDPKLPLHHPPSIPIVSFIPLLMPLSDPSFISDQIIIPTNIPNQLFPQSATALQLFSAL